MRRFTALLAALVVAVGLAACGSDDDTSSGDDDGGAGTTTSTAEPTTTTFAGSTTPVSEPAPEDLEGTSHLVDVRVAAHPQEGIERVVFEFDRAVPGYEVSLAEPPFHEAGSGREVDVAGDAFLHVRTFPASRADLSGEEAVLVYEGPDRVTGDTEAIVEVVLTGDFEAVMEWVIGLADERPFHAYFLGGPPRLVIDVPIG